MNGFSRKYNYSPDMGSYTKKYNSNTAIELLRTRIEEIEEMLQYFRSLSRDHKERIDTLSRKIDDIRSDKVVQKRLAVIEGKRLRDDKTESERRMDGIHGERSDNDERDIRTAITNNGRSSAITYHKENEEFYAE